MIGQRVPDITFKTRVKTKKETLVGKMYNL